MALRIGLVAHDALKAEMVAWAERNSAFLARHSLVATGTTGQAISESTGLPIERLLSGPLGGDAQLGVRIVERDLDLLVFFIDTMSAMPHDVDVKALVRLAIYYDIILACNVATADAAVKSLVLRHR